MQPRKDPLENGYYYHIYSRSIAKFEIFNSADDFHRIHDLLELLRFKGFDYRYSRYNTLSDSIRQSIRDSFNEDSPKIVDIVSYCIMPTHLHLLLKQNSDKGISIFISKVLNSYTRYFNLKHNRMGPLWSSRFKNVLVDRDEQLLHLSRYIHLNPVSAGLADSPEDWYGSSYNEYIGKATGICNFDKIIDITPGEYCKFVNDRKEYQRELSIIKSKLIDNYTG